MTSPSDDRLVASEGPTDDIVTPADGDVPPEEQATRAEPMEGAEPMNRPEPTGRPEPGMDPMGRAEPAERAAAPADTEVLLSRWHDIQSGFVDDPHAAVASADGLVREALHAASLRTADTETLRQAIRGYRTVLESLLHRPRHD